METHPRKLVTIIAEALLEERLTQAVEKAGARGWTLARVHGEGSKGVHASDWEGRNVRIETVVGEDVADRLLTVLAEQYFPHFSVVAYVQDVEVVRGAKYG